MIRKILLSHFRKLEKPLKFSWVGASLLFSPVLRLTSQRSLIIFNYHRIKNNPHSSNFDDHVFGPTANEFESHLKILAKYGTPLSEQNIIEHIKLKKDFPKNAFLITFDDGYKDNFTLAAPLLKKYKIPAIFFVPTQIINERKITWWDEIAFYSKKLGCSKSEVEKAIVHFKKLSLADKEAYLQKMRNSLPKSANSHSQIQAVEQQFSNELMSWENLKQLPEYGIQVGSHTHTHPILSSLSYEEQFTELQLSKRLLEENLGITVHSIAYPVGSHIHFNENSKKAALNCGYQLGFSFLNGVRNTIKNLDPFNIHRVSPFISARFFESAFFTQMQYQQAIRRLQKKQFD